MRNDHDGMVGSSRCNDNFGWWCVLDGRISRRCKARVKDERDTKKALEHELAGECSRD